MLKRTFRRMIYCAVCTATMVAAVPSMKAQQEFFTREDVIKYTSDWKGERFADGRPKGWLKENEDHLPVPKEQIEDILNGR